MATTLGRRFGDALAWAAELHDGQARKGTEIPYVSHLLTVTALVLEAGGREEQAIAAVLHDAVEDRPNDGRTAEEIGRRFGERVLRIVEACSDKADGTEARTPENWRQRKAKYLAHLAELDADALLVTLADKVHNAGAIAAGGRIAGEALWQRFNATKEQQAWYYRGLATGLRRALERLAVPSGDRRWRLMESLEVSVAEIEVLAGSAGTASLENVMVAE